ncbi:hypothetical protein [Inquilinus sp. OTU3971]|uniref:hypothetical protein n=1 Tax=Inquilinus sp. OTU3971 TaxID=3043855 RepID=UPI00313AC00A
MRLLRLLNLLEPGKPVISITKVSMWLSLLTVEGLVVTYVLGYLLGSEPLDIVPIIAAVGTFFLTTVAYAWRRFVAWQTGCPGLKPDPEEGRAS